MQFSGESPAGTVIAKANCLNGEFASQLIVSPTQNGVLASVYAVSARFHLQTQKYPRLRMPVLRTSKCFCVVRSVLPMGRQTTAIFSVVTFLLAASL